MRITNPTNPTPAANVENTPPQPPRGDDAASGVSSGNAASPSAPSVPVQVYSLVPSFELLSLNALLQQVPPIRPDALAEAVQRLASGELQTPDALSQTASAILGL